VASARVLQLQQEVAIRDQYQKNINNVEGRLQLEEGQLSSVGETIDRIRELTLQSGNGGYTLDDRKILTSELKVLVGELADLMNSRDASGEYIFAGFKGSTEPFVEADPGNYVYHGDDGQRQVDIASSTKVPISDSGNHLFVDIPAAQNTFYTYANPNNSSSPAATITQGVVTDQEAYDAFYPEDLVITFNDPSAIVPAGPNYSITQKSDGREVMANMTFTPGSAIAVNGVKVSVQGEPNPGDSFMVESSSKQGLLTTVGRLIEGLATIENSDPEALRGLIDTTIANLDNAQTRLLEVRSEVGARLNTVESTANLLAQIDITSQKMLSDLQDLDYAEAASRLSFESFVLEAAQQSYLKVANLSLFNYL
jgi:flagellar hook-associated protein 3 FlgL